MLNRAPSPPNSVARPIEAYWQILADALQVQRLYLHLGDWHAEVATDSRCAELGGRPSVSADPVHHALEGQLQSWLELPQRHGLQPQVISPLAESVAAELEFLGSAIPDSVRDVMVSAAWWTGFFGAIRHRGLHHQTLQPTTARFSIDELRPAAQVVALGLGLRALRAFSANSVTGVDDLYTRFVERILVWEPLIPSLCEKLGELRLVDLVSLTFPWRGQFIKFAGGSGPGQVEG